MRLPNPENYEHIGFELNKGKKHKYDAILKNKFTGQIKRVPFGGKYPDGTPYEQFEDKIGQYSKYDHKDLKRRWNWLKRHSKNTDYKFSSAYFSKQFLW
jgi:hypothetical protein